MKTIREENFYILAKNTTVVSSAKGKTETSASSTAVNTKASASPPNSMIVGMEYSPFSTPNVWFNRTSSSNAPQKMNFASVAAANIATTSTTSSAMSVRVSSPLSMCLPNSNSVAAHQIHHRSSMPTSSEINGVGCEIIGDDQRKAPGYRNKYIPPSPTTTTNVSFAVPPPNLHQQSHSLLTDNSNGAQDWYAAPSSNHQRTSSDYRGNEILSSPSTKIQQQPQRAFTPPPSMHATEPVSNGISSGMSSFYDSSSSRQQPFLNAAFDSDGRRSAGTLSGYFSPISLPRPASATATVNVPTGNFLRTVFVHHFFFVYPIFFYTLQICIRQARAECIRLHRPFTTIYCTSSNNNSNNFKISFYQLQ